ncbi:OmpA family protein [Tenacibaculum aestuariivivum]|uniref:OmpA family protein n=1 Tax=Tenacibaculum aestuariivivum TaxID=2006131 RepID=UPI003AB4D5D3
MNLRKTLLLMLLIVTINNFAQSQKVADRYFNELSYVQSAKLYKALVEEKGDTSKHVLSRLAESYYNNSQTENAEIWYKKLIESQKEKLEDKHLFKYAQVLRSNGKYKKSDSIFLKLSPSEKSNRKEELQKEDYLSDYSNNEIRIGVRNLAINTPFSDFGGFLLNGNSYYTSATPKGGKKERIYKWNNQPFLNIYKANEQVIALEENVKDTVLTLVNQRLIEVPITSVFHESTPVFTKDGKTIYFTRNNASGKKAKKDKNNTSNLKIYRANFINGFWINVRELPFNNSEYSVGHPALSPDEKTLYFVSNMPGGFGATDIYKVAILDNNSYGSPVNLGENINTSDKEMFPFITEENNLYFSSNGHLGFGLLDIFQSKIIKDSIYSKAVNIGYPFNSQKDDFSFYINNEGKKGFFSSNRKGGKGDDDIYSFYMYTDSPICSESIEGIVTETVSNTSIDGAAIQLVNSSGKVIKETFTNTEGKYLFDNVLCDSRYTILASKLDHRLKNKKETVIVSGKVNKVNLELIPLIIGDQIVINPIYFDYGESIIREDAQYELESIVMVMTNHPEVSIKIESHTDSRGGKDFNRDLSDKRAKSTQKYLLSRGIKKERIISAIGYGEDQLLNKCNETNNIKCTEEEHQKNRRSYFYIVKGEQEIKKRQEVEKKEAKKRINKKNNFLLFLRKNFKKTGKERSVNKKCIIGKEEKCNDKKNDFKINYKN